MERVRHPAVAGRFYPADPDGLRRAVEGCYQHPIGPGEPPGVASQSVAGIAGFVVPHAAYQYSGPVAAHAFHRMAELGPPSVVVILGPNHYSVGRQLALSPWGQWDTPLGSLSVDTELGEGLAAGVPQLAPDPEPHLSEHSLEVQLPFLLHLYGSQVAVLPISMADHSLQAAQLLGKELARALSDRSALVLASSDLSHYLRDAEARREDRYALEAITAVEPERLAEVVETRGLSMCGPGPVMAMLVALRELNPGGSGQLLAYATSGDTSGGTSSVVGYAAVAVEAARASR